MDSLVSDLVAEIAQVHLGGGQTSMQRHLSRGKLAPRQRVDALLDPGSAFLEIAPLAAKGLYAPDNVASAGLIAGIGKIHGKECMVIANGSWFSSRFHGKRRQLLPNDSQETSKGAGNR